MLRCCGCFSQHFCAQGSYGKVYLAKDRLPKMDTFVTVVITNIPLALIFKSSWGHCAIAFGSSFFWGRLVQPVTTSPFPFLSSPLLPLRASPPQTSKNHQKWTGSASRKTIGFKQGSRILGKALRLTELRTASLKTRVLSQAVSCAVWEGLEGRREEMTEDSPHSRSDRLLQAQVWRGFGLRFQMKSGGRNAWLGHVGTTKRNPIFNMTMENRRITIFLIGQSSSL